MNKVLGICAVAAVSVGVGIVLSKALAVRKTENVEDDLLPVHDSKADEIFAQAAKTLDEMKTSTAEFYSSLKNIFTRSDTSASETDEMDDYGNLGDKSGEDFNNVEVSPECRSLEDLLTT